MPVIKYPDGTEVWVDEVVDEEPPAHTRRGRFDRARKNKESERQRLERGLAKLGEVSKEFLLDEDEDDVSVIGKMLKAGGIIKD